MKQTEHKPRGIRLSEATWEQLDKLRAQHGSYDKALRAVLGVNGKAQRKAAAK